MNGSSNNGKKVAQSSSSLSSQPSEISENGSEKEQGKATTRTTPTWAYLTLVVLVLVSYFTIPVPFQPAQGEEPTVNHVFYYGWLTALSTGVGVFPFFVLPNVDSYWVGVSNAIAAGMMVAASYSLFMEGCTYADPRDKSEFTTEIRTVAGAVLGLAFILITKKFLDQYEDLKFGGMGGTDARKALLIFCLMTVHSISEGVGIGVSFGGIHGSQLGTLISASLAAHNVPEGLAIAVVLLPRGVTAITATVWAVSTSLPQPLMAVPAYLFVHYFVPILPVGLGFAGGAMAWVAFFELLSEAIEDTSIFTSGAIAMVSLATMMMIQIAIEDTQAYAAS